MKHHGIVGSLRAHELGKQRGILSFAPNILALSSSHYSLARGLLKIIHQGLGSLLTRSRGQFTRALGEFRDRPPYSLVWQLHASAKQKTVFTNKTTFRSET